MQVKCRPFGGSPACNRVKVAPATGRGRHRNQRRRHAPRTRLPRDADSPELRG
jgi:hypothetical protein